jgi:hypothetical protein
MYFRWIPFRPLNEFQPRVAYRKRAIDLVSLWQADESGDAVITLTNCRDKACIKAAKPDGLRCQRCIMKGQVCIGTRKSTPYAISAEKKQNPRLVKDEVCPAVVHRRKTLKLRGKLSKVRRSAWSNHTSHHHSADRVPEWHCQFFETRCSQSANLMDDFLVLDNDKLGTLFVV